MQTVLASDDKLTISRVAKSVADSVLNLNLRQTEWVAEDHASLVRLKV